MKAVILAAGIGSRIRPLTDNTPKSLLPVAGHTILGRMLTNIKNVGITEVGIVTGYLEDKIKTFIIENFPTLSVTFIPNEKYLETNTGYSLMLVKDFIAGDSFVKFDADVVFEEEVLKKLVTSPYPSALCIDRNINLAAEEVKVVVSNDNKVLQVGKKISPEEARGESIGIEKISREAGTVLFQELKNLMQDENNYKEYYDDSYTTLVVRGVPFYAVDITGLKWVEIDTHEDYHYAEELFAL